MNFVQTYPEAIKRAKKLAKQGPRVAAVLKNPKADEYGAVPGYMDCDAKVAIQVALVTPDGRVWKSR